ncbi:MAG: NAD(P)/FAD-dependent oxidoreductase, partial [Paracoccaceae bacterium]
RVRVYEKRRVGGGASGGLVGALAPHTPDNWNEKKRLQFESLIRARSYWPEVDALSGLASGYGNTGRLVAIPDQRALELARARENSATEIWCGLADWRVVACGRFSGWEPPSRTGYLVHETLSARMSPLGATQSLARALEVIGGEIVIGATTGRGADATVLATGYEGLLELSAELGRPVGKGVKGQALLLACDRRDQPQLFADGVHVIAHADGTVAIGSTSEIDWKVGSQTDKQLDDLHARAVELVPALAGARVLARRAGVRPRGNRRAPIIGAHPGRDRVFIANGGFRIGFGVAIRAAELLADLILTGSASFVQAGILPRSFKARRQTRAADLDEKSMRLALRSRQR